MEVVLFRIRPRADLDQADYKATFERMWSLVSDVPGFVDIQGYGSPDGTELAVARFETTASIAQWRDQHDHALTRERGRREFFESYDIMFCAALAVRPTSPGPATPELLRRSVSAAP